MEPIGLLVTLSAFRITMKINYEVTRIVKDGDKVGTVATFWLHFESRSTQTHFDCSFTRCFKWKRFLPTLKIHKKKFEVSTKWKMFRGHTHLNFDLCEKDFVVSRHLIRCHIPGSNVGKYVTRDGSRIFSDVWITFFAIILAMPQLE